MGDDKDFIIAHLSQKLAEKEIELANILCEVRRMRAIKELALQAVKCSTDECNKEVLDDAGDDTLQGDRT